MKRNISLYIKDILDNMKKAQEFVARLEEVLDDLLDEEKKTS